MNSEPAPRRLICLTPVLAAPMRVLLTVVAINTSSAGHHAQIVFHNRQRDRPAGHGPVLGRGPAAATPGSPSGSPAAPAVPPRAAWPGSLRRSRRCGTPPTTRCSTKASRVLIDDPRRLGQPQPAAPRLRHLVRAGLGHVGGAYITAMIMFLCWVMRHRPTSRARRNCYLTPQTADSSWVGSSLAEHPVEPSPAPVRRRDHGRVRLARLPTHPARRKVRHRDHRAHPDPHRHRPGRLLDMVEGRSKQA